MADQWKRTILEVDEDERDEHKVVVRVLDKDTVELVAEVEIHAHATKVETHESFGLTVRNWRSL